MIFMFKTCQMIFEVQGKTDTYVKLVKDEEGVSFLASRFLVEYEIQAEALEVKSKNSTSVATVKIVFRRKVQYYVASTFLQVVHILRVLSFFSYV